MTMKPDRVSENIMHSLNAAQWNKNSSVFIILSYSSISQQVMVVALMEWASNCKPNLKCSMQEKFTIKYNFYLQNKKAHQNFI